MTPHPFHILTHHAKFSAFMSYWSCIFVNGIAFALSDEHQMDFFNVVFFVCVWIRNMLFRIFVKNKHLNDSNNPIKFDSWHYFLLKKLKNGSGIHPLSVMWDQGLAQMWYMVSVVLCKWSQRQHSCKECSLSWSQRHCSFSFHRSLDLALHKSKFI